MNLSAGARSGRTQPAPALRCGTGTADRWFGSQVAIGEQRRLVGLDDEFTDGESGRPGLR